MLLVFEHHSPEVPRLVKELYGEQIGGARPKSCCDFSKNEKLHALIHHILLSSTTIEKPYEGQK